MSKKPLFRRFRGDPNSRSLRIADMLTESELFEVPTISHARRAHVRLSAVKEPQRKISKVTATPDDTQKWIDLMIALRDHQDRTAFVQLFEHFAPRVKAFLMRGGMDRGKAEECAQDVMTTLWTKAHLFDPTRASVATWVFTIARNRRIDLARKDRRPEPEDLDWGPASEPDQSEALALQEDTETLGLAIAALPEKQRELIEKAYFGDLSHSEIAEITGLPLGTIKSRIRLALDRLRHALG